MNTQSRDGSPKKVNNNKQYTYILTRDTARVRNQDKEPTHQLEGCAW